ncbi:hypothetical protein [Sphingomonas sp.]|uniref:hypothetical protein n=1 Tax=Sphingomonas sp. TaxID=28214 RepID=UPI003BA9A5D0
MFQAVVAASIIIAPGPVASFGQNGSQPQDAHDRAFVAWQIKTLRDPDSANWRRIKQPFATTVTLKRGLLGKKEWSGELACYTLNGKNAYGAYVGYTPHAVLITSQGEVHVWEGMSPSEDQSTYRSWGQQIIDNYCR